jgi:hypothetical protein
LAFSRDITNLFAPTGMGSGNGMPEDYINWNFGSFFWGGVDLSGYHSHRSHRFNHRGPF